MKVCTSRPRRMYVDRCSYCSFSTPWTFSFHHHLNTKHILHYTDCSVPLDACDFPTTSKFQATHQNVAEIHKRRNSSFSKHAQKLAKYEKRLKQNGGRGESTKNGHGHAVEVKWYPCKSCLYKSKFKSSLKVHVLAKHTNPSQIIWYSCGDCVYKSKFRRHLHRHMIEVHLKRPIADWYYCDKCTFRSKRKGNVMQHLATAHENPSKIKWYQCEICPFKSKWHSHLKTHLSSEHSDPDNVPWCYCAQCPYKAKRKSHIKRHILSRHNPSKRPWKRRQKNIVCE